MEGGLKLLVPEREIEKQKFFCQGHYSCVSGDLNTAPEISSEQGNSPSNPPVPYVPPPL